MQISKQYSTGGYNVSCLTENTGYDSADFKSLIPLGKLIVKVDLIYFTVTPCSSTERRAMLDSESNGWTGSFPWDQRLVTEEGVDKSGEQMLWEWPSAIIILIVQVMAVEQRKMRGPKTKGQGNGYIICKEVKIGDRREGGTAGGGEREVCVPRFSQLTDICPPSAPHFWNTGLIHFSLAGETSRYWHPLFLRVGESHGN